MGVLLVGLAVAAGAVYIATMPAGASSVAAPVPLTPEQIQARTERIIPIPDLTPTAPNVLALTGTGASIGTSILPGAGTVIGAGVGALVGWIKSWFGPSEYERFQQAFAQYLGFPNIDAVLGSLSSIGRDDLVYAIPQVRPELAGDEFSLREYVEQKQALLPQFQTWMVNVIQAYQDAGYQFPA